MLITNLLANMVVLANAGEIPTNTAAFQQYAFQAMFNRAAPLIEAWRLEMPHPVETNMVTEFNAQASPVGLSGCLVFSNRYRFAWQTGGFPLFVDMGYNYGNLDSDDTDRNDAVLDKWAAATNLLTKRKAREIARSVVRSVGVSARDTGFVAPNKAKQWGYEKKDGRKLPLPLYEFKFDAKKDGLGAALVEVSGITSNVVYFFYCGPLLRFDRPPDYLEMLGLPTNTVFVKRLLALPGQPQRYEAFKP